MTIKVENHLISHSEVEAFGQCKKKHDYAHIQKLQPKTQGIALNKGNAGHRILEVFLLGIKEGLNDQDAKMKAFTDPEAQKYGMLYAEVLPWCGYWIDHVWPTLGWKVVDVEREYRVPISQGLIYPFKTDALVEIRGELFFVDHKFMYDAMPGNVIDLMPQLPRYIGAARKLGIPVKGGIYNFIRTRKLNNPADRFAREPVNPNNHRIMQSMKELVQEMKEIDRIESLPEEERPIPVRVANKMNCGHCGFAPLCTLELNGMNSKYMRENDYTENTYGYKELPEDG